MPGCNILSHLLCLNHIHEMLIELISESQKIVKQTNHYPCNLK